MASEPRRVRREARKAESRAEAQNASRPRFSNTSGARKDIHIIGF